MTTPSPLPGFVRLASGPALPSAPVPAIGDCIATMYRGHCIRGMVQRIETTQHGTRILCLYKGLAADPVTMIRAVWLDYGAGIGIREGGSFTTNIEAIALAARPFKL